MKFYIIQSVKHSNFHASHQKAQESLGNLDGSLKDLKEFGGCFDDHDAMMFNSPEEAKEWANTYLPEGKPYIIVECTGKVI